MEGDGGEEGRGVERGDEGPEEVLGGSIRAALTRVGKTEVFFSFFFSVL